jgi:hypothetical protein
MLKPPLGPLASFPPCQGENSAPSLSREGWGGFVLPRIMLWNNL